jgi:hypothetical protein
MSSLHRRAGAGLALIAVTALAGGTAAAAQRAEPRERAEHAEHVEHRARVVHSERAAAYAHTHAAVRPQTAHALAPQTHVVRYGNALNGSVEHPIRPGFVSRTYVSGGHVLYTHVYQSHVWHQFGRSFTYEAYVPAVRFPAAYYGWALAPWPHPVLYSWGWRAQPWYPVYGALFTPYPVYASPDLWMTDYILAQNMQAAWQAQAVAPPPPAATNYLDPAAAPGATDADSSYVDPAAAPGAVAPSADPSAPPPSPGEAAPAAPAPTAPPPAITPQIKAQLDAQIKVQLQEQQAATATPATLTTPSGPAALRPNHVFFAVVQPLDVASGPNRHCRLSANDYIKRTGGMSADDWMIPVVVELSAPSDCPEGLATRIGLNDLNAMENEQEAQVLQAMRAASRSMGPNGPGPAARPSQIADGSATPDPGVLDALRQAQ